MRFAAVLLILAAALPAAHSQAPHLELKDLTVAELKKVYLSCNTSAANGQLGAGDIKQCSMVYEELKFRGFGGDFLALLAWSRSQAPLQDQSGSNSR